MASEIITRSGITPNESGLPFTISTADVRKYLQTKIDVICDAMAKQGNTIGHIDIMVYSPESFGRRFIPFSIFLPTDILSGKRKNVNKGEPSIFNPTVEDKAVDIIQPIYNLLKCYSYSSADKEAFQHSKFLKRELNLSGNNLYDIMRYMTPKVLKFSSSRYELVTMLLDPIRVFHDMLIIPGSKNDFNIAIESCQKIRDNEYNYNIIRSLYGGKNKNKNRINIGTEFNNMLKRTNRK